MSRREIDLALERGRLQERIAAQRAAIAVQMAPIAGALATADRAISAGRKCGRYAKQHPLQIGAAFLALAAMRPRSLWRWGQRALLAWGTWRKARELLALSGLLKRQRS